jgi:bacterioferritin
MPVSTVTTPTNLSAGTPATKASRFAARAHAAPNPNHLICWRTSRSAPRSRLVAERIAVASYSEMINWVGTADPTTRRVLEDILANEEEHADDMVSLLES